MSHPITLKSLETEYYTQKQIQEETVKNGLARCARETKEKSLQKLRIYLQSAENIESFSCKLQIDDDMPMKYLFPTGKNKNDLVAHIYNFFNSHKDLT